MDIPKTVTVAAGDLPCASTSSPELRHTTRPWGAAAWSRMGTAASRDTFSTSTTDTFGCSGTRRILVVMGFATRGTEHPDRRAVPGFGSEAGGKGRRGPRAAAAPATRLPRCCQGGWRCQRHWGPRSSASRSTRSINLRRPQEEEWSALPGNSTVGFANQLSLRRREDGSNSLSRHPSPGPRRAVRRLSATWTAPWGRFDNSTGRLSRTCRGGRRRIRTSVGCAGDFTDRSLWPLGHPSRVRPLTMPMAKQDFSFDIVSEVDLQEVRNAVDQAAARDLAAVRLQGHRDPVSPGRRDDRDALIAPRTG